jgi:hypothetical protein
MEESWKDALSSLWNGLLYGPGAARFLRVLLAILLILSIGWSIYLYKEIITISRIPPRDSPIPQRKVEQDKKYADLTKGFEEVAQARFANKESSFMASALGRYAFNKPPVPVVQEELAKAAARGRASSSELEEVYMPYMEVRAVMILNKKAMALMDIEGEGYNLIVSPGYRFGKGRGKVISITPAKVVVLWAGTKMELKVDVL